MKTYIEHRGPPTLYVTRPEASSETDDNNRQPQTHIRHNNHHNSQQMRSHQNREVRHKFQVCSVFGWQLTKTEDLWHTNCKDLSDSLGLKKAFTKHLVNPSSSNWIKTWIGLKYYIIESHTLSLSRKRITVTVTLSNEIPPETQSQPSLMCGRAVWCALMKTKPKLFGKQ